MKLHAFVDTLFSKKSDTTILLIDLNEIYDLLIKSKTEATLIPQRSLNLPGLKSVAYRQKSKRLFCFAADAQSIR
ncbi:MAG: hypothetical protein ABL925_03110 [Methylococcales bacterium]